MKTIKIKLNEWVYMVIIDNNRIINIYTKNGKCIGHLDATGIKELQVYNKTVAKKNEEGVWKLV